MLPWGIRTPDVHEVGPAFVVVTDDNLQLAQEEADRLSDMLWGIRDQFTLDLPDAAQAVQQAMSLVDGGFQLRFRASSCHSR